jgi:signal transduction histidine kinase/CheY-like chemotaxis protein
VTSWITASFWKPRITGGSSKAKADLIIRSYFRVFLVAFALFLLTAADAVSVVSTRYRWIPIIAPVVRLICTFIFCKTDSERKAGYTSILTLYGCLYLLSKKEVAFDMMIMHSAIYLTLCGVVMGSEGVLLSIMGNFFVGYSFQQQQRLYNTAGRDFDLLWQTYVVRIFTEGVLMLIAIRKFTETFVLFEQADKHRTEFLCRMSHELRTPLSGIIGAIDILKFAPLTDEYVKLINIAKTCSANLLQLINDILDFSKIEAGKMRLVLGNIRLRPLVSEASEVISPLLNQKKLIKFESRLKGDLPDMFFGDKTKVKQILVNLLSNAVKFTAEGTISLRVKMAGREKIHAVSLRPNTMVKDWSKPETAELIQFTVKDTGIGVRKKDFDAIFSAFEQVASMTKDEVIGGTGLGLNICLLLVNLMDGAICIRSAGLDEGSKFTFWVPYVKAQAGAPLRDSNEENNVRVALANKNVTRVLLVEDNAVNQLVIKGQLTKLGCCSVDIAANGLIAVQKLKLIPPPHYDIILLDLEMPVKDGIETVTELRSMGVTTPIIALTAHAVEEKRTMALKAGMDDFLMKPCSIDTLKQCLDKYRHKFK